MRALVFFLVILPLALYFWRQTLSLIIVFVAIGFLAFLGLVVYDMGHDPCTSLVPPLHCH